MQESHAFTQVVNNLKMSNSLAYITTNPHTLEKMCPYGMEVIKYHNVKINNELYRHKCENIFDASSIWKNSITEKRECSINIVFEKLESIIATHIQAIKKKNVILFRPGSPNISDSLAKKWISTFSELQVINVKSSIEILANDALTYYRKIGLEPKSYLIVDGYMVVKKKISISSYELMIVTSVQNGYNTSNSECIFCQTIDSLKEIYSERSTILFINVKNSKSEIIYDYLFNAKNYCCLFSSSPNLISIAIYNE